MTISELLKNCRKIFQKVDVKYAHPSLYILCVDDQFQSFDEDVRRTIFLEKTDIDFEELELLEAAATISLELCTESERQSKFFFLDDDEAAQHWLPLLDETIRENLAVSLPEAIPAIHFYGFKGGQARSTVLAMFAKSLAADGYRVLVVDVDIEAPSLDLLFDVSAPDVSTTLMGLCGWSNDFSPVQALGSLHSRGAIDIVPCRPRSDNYDMDFAAFSIRAALDISTISNGLKRLKAYIAALEDTKKYDIVLFDHRTGIAPSVLPAIREWRGPTVIAVRPDGLSTQAIGAFASLFAQNPDNPGAFICFSLDAEDSRAAIFQRVPQQIQELLGELSRAIARGAETEIEHEEDDLPPEALQKYWVSWFADRALFSALSPPLERLGSENQNSLGQLREVLGFAGTHHPVVAESVSMPRVSSPSGAMDPGWFIETTEISRLFLPSSSLSYIVGRKGTGKTRLYKEMISRELAEPLFASADFSGGGVKSQSTVYSLLLESCNGDFKVFWWSLLAIALSASNSTNSAEFDSAVTEWCNQSPEQRKEQGTAHFAVKLAGQSIRKRFFLIDGIETAVPSAQLRVFIEEMLLFMLTIQSDSKLSAFIFIRVFLRTDLLRNATQNIEQQTSHRKLELRWDSDSIFNFVLARIELLDWFNENFRDACDLIRQSQSEIRAGKVSRTNYEPLLLSIFPKKLRRNNLQTITFFETYFSDAGGDNQERASFYPRLFESFLNQITVVAKNRSDKGLNALEDGRVTHSVVLEAHAAASAAFITEVTQELYALLNLDNDDSLNRRLVDSLIASFEGQPTPFSVEEIVKSLQHLVNGLEASKIRDALQRMREVGIFEGRPGYPGQWRAGRLYKSALRMKYVR
jgi:MinD-like ATPase involved in chromosome partitioning or flagellar assembly